MKLKSFCETKRRKPFDWNAFLRKKSYTWAELSRATKLSGNWVTCACGNQCAIIPRYKNDDIYGHAAPVDEKLRELGCQFHDEIVSMDWTDPDREINAYRKAALRTLRVIERRSTVLIKQLTKK